MKRNLAFKIISLAFCIILVFTVFTGCPSTKTLNYTGAELESVKVGELCVRSVATAKYGSENEGIKYEIKSGNLPVGMFMNADGEISGTPRAKTAAPILLTVTASMEGYKSVDAVFSLTVSEGTLVYEGKDNLFARLGITANINIATASGTPGTITYSLKAGSNVLPDGLSFNNGRITGVPTTPDQKITFTVISTATDCKPAEAEFTIETGSRLEYAGRTLPAGTAGVFYTADIATAAGTNLPISYALKTAGTLPAGLELEDGLIIGIPEAQVMQRRFTVIASAAGLDSVEAEFMINILPAEEIEELGEVKYIGRTLPEGFVGEIYNRLAANGVGTATATNQAPVTYAFEEGSSLPAGLTLQRNGSITGTPTVAAAGHKFTVTASAEGCNPASAEFTITIHPSSLRFPQGFLLPDGKKGVSYSQSLATAYAVNGVTDIVITYTVKPQSEGGKALPGGLILSPQGVLSGIPTKISKIYSFIVVASAEGYHPAETDAVITIHDAFASGVTKFEAEYTDLTGIYGSGYSGGAEGTGIIGDNSNASNEYILAFTHGVTHPFTFNIHSSAAVSGVSFWIALGSEIGELSLNNNVFDIRINGKSIAYTLTITKVGVNDFDTFDRFLISSNINLPAGDFTVELEVIEGNTLMGGSREGGPGIDYIEFGNLGGAVLSWTPWTINLLSDGQEGN